MLLFRMADLSRRVRRLIPPLPLDPTATALEGQAGSAVVEWTLTPTLLDADERRLLRRITRVLSLYAEAEGQPRAAVEALSVRIEEMIGNYRLARCLVRTIEQLGFEYVAPPLALPHEPAALRALCYRRAQEQHNGYVPRAERAAFLAAVAADLETTSTLLEAALWADRADAALLQRRAYADGAARPADALSTARVIARYNAAAVATVLAASSWVTLHLAASETAALKDLYRCARALHVGVEITRGSADGVLDVTLYGPGSRALVRSRAALAGGERPGEAGGHDGEAAAGADLPADDSGDGLPAVDAGNGRAPGDEWNGDGAGDTAGVGAGETDGIRVPAAGGSPVAAVVTRLAQRHAGAIRGGWTRLLGFERRLYHVSLDEQMLAALRAGLDDVADAGAEAALYDSAVEEKFARAFHAHAREGRGGLVRGWTLQREPRIVVVGATVFLPDFAFLRGDVEVYGEVIGYYTEDYLTRKRRKLAVLRGQIPLLLIADQDLAPVFADSGFPLVTYKAGRQISVTDVVYTLEHAFDPFAGRRERAHAVLARLCATAGPDMSEEDLSEATGCAGRSELLTLWADLAAAPQEHDGAAAPDTAGTEDGGEIPIVAGTEDGGAAPAIAGMEGGSIAAPAQLRAVAEAKEIYSAGAAADRFQRRYLPGYGLIQGGALAAAQAALSGLLHEAGDPIPLGDALSCVREAGVPDADEALLERLGVVVARADLFGEAQVHLPGAAPPDAVTPASPAATATSGKRRHRRKEAAASEGASLDGQPANATPDHDRKRGS